MLDPRVPGLPSISVLAYAKTLIAATLDAPPPKQVTAGLFAGPVSGTPLVSKATTGSVIQMFYDQALDPGIVYNVAIAFDPVNGPWGMPVALVWQQPALATAIVGPNEIAVAWSLPVTTTIAQVRATLVDNAAGTRLATGTFSGAGTRLVPPVPLSPTGNYGITLVGVNGVASGPMTTSPAFTLAAPAIASAIYAAAGTGSYAIAVTLQGTIPAGASVVAQLLRDGVVVQQQTSTTSPVTITVTRPLDPRSKWQLDAYYLNGVIAGPPGFAFALSVPNVPAIASMQYAGGRIVALLASPATPGATVALFQGMPSGTSWIASAQTAGTLATLTVEPSTLKPDVAYNVALTLDPTASPVIWGPPATLVWQQPSVTAVIVTGQTVDVAWSVPVPSTIESVSATLFDTAASAVVATASSTTQGMRLAVPVPLDPRRNYIVELTGRRGVAASAIVNSPSIILTAPAVSSIAYAYDAGAKSYTLTVTPQAVSGTPPGTIVGQLLQQGQVVAEQAAVGSTVKFTLAQPLAAGASWQVVLYFRSSVVTGPLGVPWTIDLPAAPGIKALSYAGGKIVASLASAPVPLATVALFAGEPSGTGWITSVTTSTAMATLNVDPSTLQPGVEYNVAVSLDTSNAAAMAWSSATMLVWQQPALAAVKVTSGAVEIGWTLPARSTIGAVQAQLHDTTSATVVAQAVFEGTGGRLVPATPLDPAHVYNVSIAGVNGVASSAAVTSSSLILAAPSIASDVYAPGATAGTYQITVMPTAAGSPPGTVTGMLLANGAVVAMQQASGGTVTFALTQALDASASWRVALLYQAGAVSGPAGVPVELPLVPPQLTAALYDGTCFYLTWSGGANGAKVVITRTDDQSVAGTQTVANGFGAKVQPAAAIDATKTYVATLAPIAGTAQGLPGPPSTLIVSRPSLASVTSDGEQVVVTLTGADASATGTQLLLASRSGSILTAEAGLSGGYAPLPAGGIAGVTVMARSVAGSIVGPASGSATVLVARPSISNVAFASNAVTGKVTAPAGVALDSPVLTVTLYADGITVGAPVQAGADGTFSIPTAGTNGAALTLTASLSGTASGVAVTGPQSSPVPVLASAPAIVSASLIQTGATVWQLSAQWTAPAGVPVGSYRATLSQDGTALNTWTVSGTSLVQTAPAFDAGKALTLTVTPLGNYGSGPASGAAVFLPSAASGILARIDGTTVSASWTASTAAGTPTAFRLRLVQSVSGGGWITVGQSEAVAGTTAALSLPSSVPDAKTVLGVALDAACGNAWASSLTVTTLVTTSPSITATTGSGNSVAVTWAWPGGTAPPAVTGYLPVVLWNGNETPLKSLPATPLQATIAVPATIPSGASIAMRALGSGVTGPAGDGAPMLFQPPTGLVVRYDGTHVQATWNAVADARVNAYAVTFKVSDQAPVVESVSGTSWSKVFTPASGQTATVNVAATAGVAAGPSPVTPVSAIFDRLSVTGAAFDGETLTLTWTAAADPAVQWTVISVLSGGRLMQQLVSGGTTASIPFANGPFTIELQGAGAATAGPPSAPPFTPITGAATINSVSFSAANGGLTLGWTAVPNAAAYHVAFRTATVTITKTATTNSLALASSDLPAGGVYSIAVQAVGSSNAIAGPWSAAVPLVLVAPASVAVTYDGRHASVSWPPVASPDVTGYVVTLFDGAAVVSTTSTATTSARLAAPFAKTKNHRVVVQAVTPSGAAMPSAATPLFAAGWYPSMAAGTPYLKPFSTPGMTASDIHVYLPNIFNSYVSTGLPATPPFVIETTDKVPFVYRLKMASDSIVWSFDTIPRTNVQAAYASLLAALVQLGVTPLGWRIVQDAISRAMPQTFAELLTYACAFDPVNGTVDLKPGMVLRAEYESYQFLGSNQPASTYLDGFVSSGCVEYEIGSYVAGANWLTGFDAFLSTVTLQGTTVPAPKSDGSSFSGGGGIVDAYYSQFRLPFLRLVYPPQFLDSTQGDARPAFNVALLAATDYPTLQTATNNLRNAQPPGSGAYATYFRGRTTLSACIRVWLNGNPMVVAVGTTVSNVLESLAVRPPIFPIVQGAPATVPGIPISGLTLTRATGYAVTDPGAATSGYDVGGGTSVMLNWAGGMAYNALSDWLSMPLLPGDRITTEGLR